MRKRLAPALLTSAFAALAGGAAVSTATLNPAQNVVALSPSSIANASAKRGAESAAPVAIQTLQAIDLAFTDRGLRHYYRRHEPIWIGYERPRRHWGGGYWRAKA